MTVPLGNPFTLGQTGVTTSARYDRLALSASFRPGSAALSAVSGFLHGPPGTMGDLTLLTDTLLRVDPFLAVIQGTHNTQQGQYVVPNVQQRDLAVPAKDASQARKALVVVRVADSLEAGVASSPTTDGAWLEILPGALAASNPQLPSMAAYANYLAAGELTIPSVASGLPVTLTRYTPRTVSRGGVLPVLDDALVLPGHGGTPPAYDGDVRWHPTQGLQEGKGGAWAPVSPQGMPVAQIRQTVGSGVYAAGWGIVNMQVADVDSHSMNSQVQPNAPRLRCPTGQGGVYEVEGMVVWNSIGASSVLNCRITKNGVAIPGAVGGGYITPGATGAGIGRSTGKKLVTLAPGDFVELEQYCSVSVQTVVFADAACMLSARRVR